MNKPNRLVKFSANHFKNIQSNDDLLLNALTVLIGPNGSGKSNFIKLLQFLQMAASESIDRSREVTSYVDAVSEVGANRILDKAMPRPSVLKVEFQFESMGDKSYDNLELHLLVHSDNTLPLPTIQYEKLYNSSGDKNDGPFNYYISHAESLGDGVISVYEGIANGKAKNPKSRYQPLKNIPVNELTLTSAPRLLERSAIPPEQAPIYEVRRSLLDRIARWRFYNANFMNLQNIRQSQPKLGLTDKFLSVTGENLSLVISNLSRDNLDFEDELLDALKSILPETHKLRAIPSGRLTMGLEWVDTHKDQYFLDELSDGTVRMLCWATILLSPEPASLLVIDEPEVGIHVAWMPILADWIKRAAAKTQVMITTHSPDLLDYFSDRVEDVVRFSATTESPKRFRPERLPQKSVQAWFDEGWKLGDLYRVGNPSVGGWPW